MTPAVAASVGAVCRIQPSANVAEDIALPKTSCKTVRPAIYCRRYGGVSLILFLHRRGDHFCSEGKAVPCTLASPAGWRRAVASQPGRPARWLPRSAAAGPDRHRARPTHTLKSAPLGALSLSPLVSRPQIPQPSLPRFPVLRGAGSQGERASPVVARPRGQQPAQEAARESVRASVTTASWSPPRPTRA